MVFITKPEWEVGPYREGHPITLDRQFQGGQYFSFVKGWGGIYNKTWIWEVWPYREGHPITLACQVKGGHYFSFVKGRCGIYRKTERDVGLYWEGHPITLGCKLKVGQLIGWFFNEHFLLDIDWCPIEKSCN